MNLSAIIIAINEERDLPGCLESLKGVADEIILIDSHSQDRTREIAKSFGARVIERDFAGYGPQKQFALGQAQNDWALNIDADERLSPELAEEIKGLKKAPAPAASGFWIPFHVYFRGSRLRFGGCAREFHIRLFRRDRARYGDKKIHEGITVEGDMAFLDNPMKHESYQNFSEYLKKCERYTGLIAEEKFAQGKRFSFWQHLRLPWEFFVRYFVKLGILDGQPGLIYALLSSYYAWLKHVRLLDFEEGRS